MAIGQKPFINASLQSFIEGKVFGDWTKPIINAKLQSFIRRGYHLAKTINRRITTLIYKEGLKFDDWTEMLY